MKPYGLTARLIRAVLLGVALGTVLLVTAEGAFTEFYMQSGGSNLNAGSTTNNTAAYTSTNGNWNGSSTFTPSDTQSSSLVSVGDFASVYNDGATVGVYIARVVTVNSSGGNITSIVLSTTVKYGTPPTSSATARSIKVGGAWAGPSGTATFPFGLSGSTGTLVNTSGDAVRINVKNNQTYSMTTGLAFSSAAFTIIQAYTTNPSDGGRATFTCNDGTQDAFTVGSGTGGTVFIDLNFVYTASSGTNYCFSFSSSGQTYTMLRCVIHGSRNSGVIISSSAVWFIECEAYDNNKSSQTNSGGFELSNGNATFLRCYSHDNNGSGGHGWYSQNNPLILFDCIAESNGGAGVKLAGGSTTPFIAAFNCNFYNNASDAIADANTLVGPFRYYENNNFVKNGGKGINVSATGQRGIIYNNGRGAGTQANGGGADVLKSIYNTSTDVTYASDVTPWIAPTTGDFSTNLAAAQGAGRGHFEENDGTNTGTVGYPDIGAAQAQIGCTFPTPTATATATPTSTATATPTATATATFTPTSTPTATATATPTAPIEASYGFSQ